MLQNDSMNYTVNLLKDRHMKSSTNQILTGMFHPSLLIIYLIRKLPLHWFFELRLAIDGVERPYYAYGLYRSAMEAKALHIKRISVYEFGVAKGDGLLSLEQLSEQVTRITGVSFDVYGFDLGAGLPEPSDYRDLPFIWKKGFCQMDVSTLKHKLKKSSTLILGNVKKTLPKFLKQKIAPVGFIAFDLDFYTSTKYALRIFDTKERNLLPRVYCYFDDVIGTDEEIMCEYTGELLSISEFNKNHKDRKVAKINGMYHKRVIKSTWSDMMYVMHYFKHKHYNAYVFPSKNR